MLDLTGMHFNSDIDQSNHQIWSDDFSHFDFYFPGSMYNWTSIYDAIRNVSLNYDRPSIIAAGLLRQTKSKKKLV